MKLIDILRKLGVLRFGATGGKYGSYKDMPDELMYNDVYDAKKDLVGTKKGRGATIIVTLTTLLLLIIASVLFASCSKPAKKPASVQKGSLGGSNAKESLDNFFSSDTKHGKYISTGKDASGEKHEQELGEFWVRGDNIRIDYYLNGKKRISIISNKGIAYFCYPDKKVCEPSVASVNHYLAQFVKPSDKIEDLGVDKATNSNKYRYIVRKTDNMKGSTNPWYTEDVTYWVTKDKLIAIESRGNIPEKDGSVKGLDVNNYKMTSLEINESIPDSIFALTYPTRNAKKVK